VLIPKSANNLRGSCRVELVEEEVSRELEDEKFVFLKLEPVFLAARED
jgi:hypothetical protein